MNLNLSMGFLLLGVLRGTQCHRATEPGDYELGSKYWESESCANGEVH
ncbi:hypothetical protein FIU95_17420 [Microbulbifer sp. THAF38]|nr:hypothetical protein FIU95_17420 [Microbulbifer sp. THAF38]